jgi:uncharacterized protein (DUF2267 family)
MQHDEFVGQVQHRARLASRGDAEGAIRATLETLADRLQPRAAAHLAAQLPPEIALHLRGVSHPQHLDLHQFYSRVASREDAPIDVAKAAFHARAVMETVGEAVSSGALRKLVRQMPEEFRDLLPRTVTTATNR